MWVQQRHQKIIELLHDRQRLTTDACADALGVSKETVRRDWIELEAAGHLVRVHGGAIRSDALLVAEPSYRERAQTHQDEKRAIARAAAGLVEAGMSCFVDAGSTTRELAGALVDRGGIQVITNSVDIAAALSHHRRIDVLLLGGRLSADVPATYGEQTVAEIGRHHPDLAIVSPVALDAVHGATDDLLQEASVARAMLGQARARILLAHAAKLGTTSRVQICPVHAIDWLVTDRQASALHLEALRAAGVRRVIQAPAG